MAPQAALVVLQECYDLRLLSSRLRDSKVDAFKILVEGVLTARNLANPRLAEFFQFRACLQVAIGLADVAVSGPI